jgi:hypothetical protein
MVAALVGIADGIIGLGFLGAAASAGGYPHRPYSAYDDAEVCYRGPRDGPAGAALKTVGATPSAVVVATFANAR